MKTNKLPKSAWSDSQEAGSQSQQASQSSSAYLNDNDKRQTSDASNDSSYNPGSANDDYASYLAETAPLQDSYFGYKSADKNLTQTPESLTVESNDRNSETSINSDSFDTANGYKKPQQLDQVKSGQSKLSQSQPSQSQQALNQKEPFLSEFFEDRDSLLTEDSEGSVTSFSKTTNPSYKEIPERIFMNGLIKHTGIALAIIIPLAAFSAYAATPPMTSTTNADMTTNTTMTNTTTETASVKPDAIIHKSASTPTTVDNVDLKKYAGTWYEIGRLPMYFQRKCAGDVTANYTEKTDGSGIVVTNKCVDKDGASITAEGLAKPVDATGSKLKVTFLPSWIRWLPVGRADYWVLARDPDYKTALVGTPDKDYLWLLARSPNISQETYAKYRQIAQQQGYDLKEFKLTAQSNQTVKLVP
ncbi:lipocalin family protein [Psychrobacter sp. B38]|uniref:lipocalin family protein n=1 Tax=Psychrobacter sp. B38 TaxID=3143538 RepID=UPI00320D960B